MTILPRTTQHRLTQLEHGRRLRTRGVVIHVMDGTLRGTLSWWARRGNRIGAHVCEGYGGDGVQTADLDAICWHAPGDNTSEAGLQFGNSEFIGIEHQGSGTQSAARWLLHMPMLRRSAKHTAWILKHYKCGYPKWGHNVVRHSAFSRTSHDNCPGSGFPRRVYMRMVKYYYNK